MSVHFSSNSVEWATPQALFDELNAEFRFTLDVCASRENAKCSRYFVREENGLIQNWGGEICWMNPPYGREIGQWIRKAYESTASGSTVVCLIPARTDTHYWHDFVMKGEIRYIRGRVKFSGSKNSAPFPSAIVIFRP